MIQVYIYGWNSAYKKVVIAGVPYLAPAETVARFFGYEDAEFPAGLVNKFLLAI